MTDISNYELKRKLNIQENENLLKELGLHNEEGIAADIPKFDTGKKKRRIQSYKKKTVIVSTKAPSRLSRRLRGEVPEENFELNDIVDENDRIKQLEVAERIQTEATTKDELPTDISVPLTLRSIGTTIWSLGKLVTGEGRSKAWSSRGCKYKHPYPVGYRATKSHFGNDYTMGILPPAKEGEGPVFTVQHKATTWTGPTPTAPWTEACIRSRSAQTRVSGPLFFGFSDPLTMKLIESMEGYDKASLPE